MATHEAHGPHGDDDLDVLVVGAGLAGLIAARRLAEAGRRVRVVDKGRGVGGRMATRRLDTDLGAVADHGAQFFTVRDPDFEAEVSRWPVQIWHHGAAQARSIEDGPDAATPGGDGHPRFCAPGGMTAIAKHLADGLDVQTGRRLTALRPVDEGWEAVVEGGAEGGAVIRARTVLATPPVPQTNVLLGGTLPDDVTALEYDPCLTLLAVLDGPAGLPEPGAVQFDEGLANHLADNTTKSVGTHPSITLHATGAWSRAHFDDSDEEVISAMTAWLRPWVASDLREVQLMRWRYATPLNPHAERAVSPAPGLVLAGDAFGGPRVEGAVLSGMAAASLLLTTSDERQA